MFDMSHVMPKHGTYFSYALTFASLSLYAEIT